MKTVNLFFIVFISILIGLQSLQTTHGISRNLEIKSRLCRNYPDAMPPYRFHRETRKCYQVGGQSPCPDLMKFTLEDNEFGNCDCDLSKRCGRPLIYWPARQKCYHVYDQGPCRDGKVLVFGFDLEPVCRKNKCWDLEQHEPSHGSRYWFSVNQTCYRTMKNGYCSEPDEVLFNMNTHYRPTCQKHADCGKYNNAQIAMCLPGQRLDVMGRCKRRFVALRNTTKPLIIHVTPKPANIYCLFCDEQQQSRQKYRV